MPLLQKKSTLLVKLVNETFHGSVWEKAFSLSVVSCLLSMLVIHDIDLGFEKRNALSLS